MQQQAYSLPNYMKKHELTKTQNNDSRYVFKSILLQLHFLYASFSQMYFVINL